MNTIIKKIDAEKMTSEDFREAAELLRAGKLVAFPTETVYGLGGDAYDKTASARIYAAKGRPSDNPLIVHIAEIGELENLAVNIPKEAYLLAERFWPGPMTMILERKDTVPKETTGGLDTVAIRMPSHPVARRLIIESGVPIAAPSANASGRPSTTKAGHVIEDLNGKIDMIIDGGSSDIGLESTIIDLTVKPALILRPGYITIEMLREVLPDTEYDKAVLKRVRDDSIVAKAPGMKYRHYAPKGQLTIYEGEREAVVSKIMEQVDEKLAEGARVGILSSSEYLKNYYDALKTSAACGNEADDKETEKCLEQILNGNHGMLELGNAVIGVAGSRNDEATVAAGLFDILREYDTKKVDYIYGECFASENLGQAIMNRLLKAAGYHIEQV